MVPSSFSTILFRSIGVLMVVWISGGNAQRRKEGDSCQATPDVMGTCRIFAECEEAKELIKKRERPALCGFKEIQPIVCCTKNDGNGPSAEVKADPENRPIRFHRRCGINMFVSEDGKGAYRKINDDFGHTAALTDRTLEPNEIFEVWLDSLQYAEAPRIGVTRDSPETIQYPDYMDHHGGGTWGWDTYPGTIYRNGEVIVEPYQKPSRQEIQRGDRFGVQVTDSGELHFHHNGKDLGMAAQGLTGRYYAYIDLYWGGSNATIVE